MRLIPTPRAAAPGALLLALSTPMAVLSAPPARAEDMKTSVTKSLNANGTGSVSLANALPALDGAQFGLDASVSGALGRTAAPTATPWASGDSSNAAAWAKMNLPTAANWLPWDQTTLDMRVDPTQESSRVGTTFTRSWDVGGSLKASVSDSYAVTRSTAQAAGGWETGKSVSLSMADTGTTLSLGTTASSDERAWVPQVSAAQKLFGPLSITTTVADRGSELTKSITAGFSHNW